MASFVASLATAVGIGSLCAPEQDWSTQINDQSDPKTLIQTVTQQIQDEVRQQLHARQPIGRMGQLDEIAYAALYLASDEAAFVTGSAFVIDGGWTAK